MGTRELVRDVIGRPVSRLVPHIGYVSLFPFMGKIIPSVSFTYHGTLVTEKNCFTSFFGSLVFASLQLGVAMPLLCSFFFFFLSVELVVVFLFISLCRIRGFWKNSLTSLQTVPFSGQTMDSVLFPKQGECFISFVVLLLLDTEIFL